METKTIINRFGISQIQVNLSISEMKNNESVNHTNFFDCTVADWKETEVEFIPNYKSDSGSQYMFTNKGVYRKSNHWTNNVNTCIWILNGMESNKETIAFCSYENFKKYSSKRINHKLSNDFVTLQENISKMLNGEMVLRHRIGNIN